MGLALHLRDEAAQATILIGSGRTLGKSPTATVPESKKSNSSRIKINLVHRTNRATEKKSCDLLFKTFKYSSYNIRMKDS
jgi:hypothetical protein